MFNLKNHFTVNNLGIFSTRCMYYELNILHFENSLVKLNAIHVIPSISGPMMLIAANAVSPITVLNTDTVR